MIALDFVWGERSFGAEKRNPNRTVRRKRKTCRGIWMERELEKRKVCQGRRDGYTVEGAMKRKNSFFLSPLPSSRSVGRQGFSLSSPTPKEIGKEASRGQKSNPFSISF